jgi:hypothetical protein
MPALDWEGCVSTFDIRQRPTIWLFKSSRLCCNGGNPDEPPVSCAIFLGDLIDLVVRGQFKFRIRDHLYLGNDVRFEGNMHAALQLIIVVTVLCHR